MPSYAQLTACNPQAFIEAGQTYQRMAQGFGRVRATFGQGLAVLDAGKLIATFGSDGGKAAAIVPEIAPIATGETTVDGPGTAATIAARVASRADLGHLGPVEREVINRVTAPTGIIGSEGLAEWTRR